MSQEKIYPVAELGSNTSHLNRESYERLYKKSIEFPEEFWSKQAEELLSWHEPWGQVKRGCLLYTSPSPRDPKTSRMPSSA